MLVFFVNYLMWTLKMNQLPNCPELLFLPALQNWACCTAANQVFSELLSNCSISSVLTQYRRSPASCLYFLLVGCGFRLPRRIINSSTTKGNDRAVVMWTVHVMLTFVLDFNFIEVRCWQHHWWCFFLFALLHSSASGICTNVHRCIWMEGLLLDVIIVTWDGNFHRLSRDAVKAARVQKWAVVISLFESCALVKTNLKKDIAVCVHLKIHFEDIWISDCYLVASWWIQNWTVEIISVNELKWFSITWQKKKGTYSFCSLNYLDMFSDRLLV